MGVRAASSSFAAPAAARSSASFSHSPRFAPKRATRLLQASCCGSRGGPWCQGCACRRRSEPPVWAHSLRVPWRDQGGIHGCMCEGQRSTRPSCFRSCLSPLVCSTTRPIMINTHMEQPVSRAPRNTLHGKSCGSAMSFAFSGLVEDLNVLAAFISCCRHLGASFSSCVGGVTRYTMPCSAGGTQNSEENQGWPGASTSSTLLL
mmetsp:Transcript_16576/g.47013  ORF Transcript_16576/g.47013 Transcript_16576/m.47013 type:complete len:204 (+) Transcript_16576:721-1332(+)